MKFSANDVRKLGTILSIWAHPDDESFCAGGILAAAAQNGQRVAVVTATRGDAGKTADEDRWPQQQLGDIREKELMNSLRILGIREHYWMDYVDGTLVSQDKDEAVAKIVAIISKVQPNTIISFGNDGITGHPDHQIIHSWTKTALQQTKSEAVFYCCAGLTKQYESNECKRCQQKFNLFFAATRPHTIQDNEADLLFDVPAELQSIKKQSIQAHECQMSKLIADSDGEAYIDSLCCCEAFVREVII